VQVVEPAGGVTANYAYDVGDRLATVTLDPDDERQIRRFTYDRRGLLGSERHPEVTGDISYKYDSQGKVRERELDGNRLFYHYDDAGRLVLIEDGDGKPWKEYSFVPALESQGDPTLAGRWGAGQLFQATRHNWLGESDKVVTETYSYDGLGGRVSRRTTRVDVPDVEFAYSLSYDQLGNVERQNYPRCTRGCGGQVGSFPRSVDFRYTRGLLTRVVGFTRADQNIAYHPNGLVNRVPHTNGVIDWVELDSSGMLRPSEMWSGKGSARSWQSGLYHYDAASNIWRLGTGAQKDQFKYDAVGRLTGGRLKVNGKQREQSFAYDPFGNIKSIITDGATRPIQIVTARNRLAGVAYDNEGNQRAHGSAQLKYDVFNMVSVLDGAANNWRYLYSAGDERLLSIERVRKRRNVWRIRDLDNRVLTEYNNQVRGEARHWPPPKDWVYRGQTLLATVQGVAGMEPDEVRHVHVDHLGSTRLITDENGAEVASYEYFPFGELATGGDEEAMLFTGHERDLLNEPGQDNDLDYMHARYYSPLRGRFLTVDPADSASVTIPQAWNRYVYADNNPVGILDPNGEGVVKFALKLYGAPTETILRTAATAPLNLLNKVGANIPTRTIGQFGKHIGNVGKAVDGFLGLDKDKGDLGELIGGDTKIGAALIYLDRASDVAFGLPVSGPGLGGAFKAAKFLDTVAPLTGGAGSVAVRTGAVGVAFLGGYIAGTAINNTITDLSGGSVGNLFPQIHPAYQIEQMREAAVCRGRQNCGEITAYDRFSEELLAQRNSDSQPVSPPGDGTN